MTPKFNMPEGELLTEDEKEALRLTGELANLLRKITLAPGKEAPINMQSRLRDIADNDWNEVAMEIHHLQHRIMAQAAARHYPSEFRLMGSIIHG